MSNIINREEDAAIAAADQPLTENSKPSEILIAAKAVISDPENWTIGFIARDVNGNPAGAKQSNAVCWCSVGAYYKVVADIDTETNASIAFNCLVRAAESFAFDSVAGMNDSNNHATVMSVWDKAIELAKQAESNNS